MRTSISDETMQEICANSYRNFHAKGMDYLCFSRTPHHTVKFYFYEGHDPSKSTEVVAPHDHRYNFTTKVVAGSMEHRRYKQTGSAGVPYDAYNWATPLNGGDGFQYAGFAWLLERSRERYTRGQRYWCNHSEIHTIHVSDTSAIIRLDQFEDVVPIGEPTSTFFRPGSEPSISGLYDRMTEDYAIKLIRKLEACHEL